MNLVVKKFNVYMDGDKSKRIEGERPIDKARQEKSTIT